MLVVCIIHLYNLLRLYNITCMCFRADYLRVDNKFLCSSLGKLFLLNTRFLSWLQFFVWGWGVMSFAPSILTCLLMVSLFSSCLGNHVGKTFAIVPEIPRRYTLKVNSMFLWILQYFFNVLWTLGQELCCRCINWIFVLQPVI